MSYKNIKDIEPIFVVGAPRSGTTLLASILSAHKNLDCGPETHFFCHLTKKWEKKISQKKEWPNSAISYLMSLSRYIWSLRTSGKNIYDVFQLSLQEIQAYLDNQEPRVPSVLESLTYLHAQKNNKIRWVEKTPNHLLYLKKIRKYYPQSLIIRIFRDFRDTAISLTKMPWGHKSLVVNMYFLNDIFYRSEPFIRSMSNIVLFSYENLLYKMEEYLNKLCDFIGETYDSNMLNWNSSAHNLYGENEWWKKSVSSPLNKSRAFLWKRILDSDMQFFLTFVGLSMLKSYSYEVEDFKIDKTILVYPATANFIANNQKVIFDLSKSRIRLICPFTLESFVSAIELECPSAIILINPIQISRQYPFYSSLERFSFVVRFLKILFKLKEKQIPIYIINKSRSANNLGMADILISRIANTFSGSPLFTITKIINKFK